MLTLRIIPSFTDSLRRNGYGDFNDRALRLWVAGLFAEGIKYSTIRRYLSGLYSVYKQWLPGSDTPDPFKPLFADISEDMQLPASEAKRLRLLPKALQKSYNADKSAYTAIILFLLHEPRMSLAGAIRLTKDSYLPSCPQAADIVSQMPAGTASKYVFPLKRGDYTDRSLARSILARAVGILHGTGAQHGGQFTEDTVRAIWISTALKAGVTIADIRSLLPAVPQQYRFLTLLEPGTLTPPEQEKIISRVSDAMCNISSRWHILRLRQPYGFDDIRSAVSACDNDIAGSITLYQPAYDKVRVNRQGKKTAERTPYLPDIVFFRLRTDRVPAFVNAVYEMAWCYKASNTPDSPYAAIAPRQMEIFQRHIGQFTDDVMMELDERNTPVLDNDTEVEITGGGMLEGHTGVIQSSGNSDGTTTYTLVINAGAQVRWTVRNISGRLITPINKQ